MLSVALLFFLAAGRVPCPGGRSAFPHPNRRARGRVLLGRRGGLRAPEGRHRRGLRLRGRPAADRALRNGRHRAHGPRRVGRRSPTTRRRSPTASCSRSSSRSRTTRRSSTARAPTRARSTARRSSMRPTSRSASPRRTSSSSIRPRCSSARSSRRSRRCRVSTRRRTTTRITSRTIPAIRTWSITTCRSSTELNKKYPDLS